MQACSPRTRLLQASASAPRDTSLGPGACPGARLSARRSGYAPTKARGSSKNQQPPKAAVPNTEGARCCPSEARARHESCTRAAARAQRAHRKKKTAHWTREQSSRAKGITEKLMKLRHSRSAHEVCATCLRCVSNANGLYTCARVSDARAERALPTPTSPSQGEPKARLLRRGLGTRWTVQQPAAS